MKKLTTEDVKKIMLYVPFEVVFEPLSASSMLEASRATGFYETTIITGFDEESDSISASSNIYYDENDDRPILRLLTDMTDEERLELQKFFGDVNVLVKELCYFIPDRCSPEILYYCLSKHFDIFGLIAEGKAINKKKSVRFGREVQA